MSIVSGGLGPGAASNIYHNCAAHSAQFVPERDRSLRDRKEIVGYYSAHKSPPKSRRLRNRKLIVDPSSRFLHQISDKEFKDLEGKAFFNEKYDNLTNNDTVTSKKLKLNANSMVELPGLPDLSLSQIEARGETQAPASLPKLQRKGTLAGLNAQLDNM